MTGQMIAMIVYLGVALVSILFLLVDQSKNEYQINKLTIELMKTKGENEQLKKETTFFETKSGFNHEHEIGATKK